MLPSVSLPISLRRLLDAFAGCFTTPTFEVFQAMVLGLIAQTGQRTVCGMGRTGHDVVASSGASVLLRRPLVHLVRGVGETRRVVGGHRG
jgi:hypothetical protein